MKTSELASEIKLGRVLLIGEASLAFCEGEAIAEMDCEIQVNMLDGIDAVVGGGFSAILIVMGCFDSGLRSALKALREVGGDARIILLAQMYEEPEAMGLVVSDDGGQGNADDYLVCPIVKEQLFASIVPGYGKGTTSSVVVDSGAVEKIRQLEELAMTDDLTGLKNRRYIWEFSRQIIERAGRNNTRVTMLIYDIDNFKHYNDVYGHAAGDEVLKQAAELMKCCCRSHDVVGRIGGDEFAVVFWDESNDEDVESERRSAKAEHPKEAIFIAKRFRRELKTAEFSSLGPEGKGVLTISGGLASFPGDGASVQEIFEQADKALLEAKHSGKNRIYLVGESEGDIADIE